jgi:glycosyltransferase involved in cell wall biosynthesis
MPAPSSSTPETKVDVKIVYLNPGGAIGGAEMCLLDVLAVARARADTRPVVILGDDGPLRGEIEALGIACDVLALPEGIVQLGDAGATGWRRRLGLMARGAAALRATLSYRARLAERLRIEKPSLVQSNGMKMHLFAAWCAPRGVPVVWHLHDYVGSRVAMARLLRRAARPGVEAVAVSRSVADDAQVALRGRIPIRAIHNAVDVERFFPGPGDGAALDRAADLPPAALGTVRVGLVATMATWKGHDIFLEALTRINTARPARFYVVGGPLYRSVGSQVAIEDLKDHAAKLGLTGRVGFTGYQADPAATLRALDIVVHASTRPEPFGRVIVEGMACGRAVVAMNEGGAAELFRDGEEALGCPPRDPAALAATIARLIDDEPLRSRLGLAGRAAALARFDRTRLSQAWAPVYDRASRRPAAIPLAPNPARPRPVAP